MMIIFLGIGAIPSFLGFLAVFGAAESSIHQGLAFLLLINTSVLLTGAAVVEVVRNVPKELA